MRAAVARVGGVNDSNLVGAGSSSLGVGGGKDRKEEGGDLGMHLECAGK